MSDSIFNAIRQFADTQPAWETFHCRVAPGQSWQDIQCGYVKDRHPKVLKLEPEHEAALKNIHAHALDGLSEEGKDLPHVVLYTLTEQGHSAMYSRKDPNRYALDQSQIGEPGSGFIYSDIILPEKIREARRHAFAQGKSPVREWRLSHVYEETDKPETTLADWLTFTPDASVIERAKPQQGLTLTFFDDGTYYDEAHDPSICLDWINVHGELDSYHTTNGGRLQPLASAMALKPEEMELEETTSIDDYLRYLDGDTWVSDVVIEADEHLIRAVSMVTDGYLIDRYFFIYR